MAYIVSIMENEQNIGLNINQEPIGLIVSYNNTLFKVRLIVFGRQISR